MTKPNPFPERLEMIHKCHKAKSELQAVEELAPTLATAISTSRQLRDFQNDAREYLKQFGEKLKQFKEQTDEWNPTIIRQLLWDNKPNEAASFQSRSDRLRHLFDLTGSNEIIRNLNKERSSLNTFIVYRNNQFLAKLQQELMTDIHHLESTLVTRKRDLNKFASDIESAPLFGDSPPAYRES